MAEEEILEEVAPAPAKKGGGGMSLISVIIIVVALVGVAGIIIAILSGRITDQGIKLEKATEAIIAATTSDGPLSSLQTLEPCVAGEKSVNTIYALSSDPIIVNLADGDHYLSAELSVCLGSNEDNKPIDEATFTGQIQPIVLHVVNEILSTKSYTYFFPTKGTGEEAAPQGGVAAFEASGGSGNSFTESKDIIRVDIVSAIRNRAPQVPIKDVYIKAFLIQ